MRRAEGTASSSSRVTTEPPRRRRLVSRTSGLQGGRVVGKSSLSAAARHVKRLGIRQCNDSESKDSKDSVSLSNSTSRIAGETRVRCDKLEE